MPKLTRLVILALLLPALALAQERASDLQPQQAMQLQLNGQKVPIQPGVPVEVEIEGQKVSVTLTLSPHRIFNEAGITFHYPAHFAWKADRTQEEFTLWTLNGNDNVLMLFRFNEPNSPFAARDTMVQSMVAQYGEENVELEEVGMKLGELELEGVYVKAVIAGTRVMQQVYGFNHGQHTFVLMLQFTPDQPGAGAESHDLEQMLKQTFQRTQSN